MTRTRPSWDNYFLELASVVATRATCLRRKYGAVIVKDHRVVSTGYNGAPSGRTDCLERNYCWRKMNNIPHGTGYENCKSVHAEVNAIIRASYEDMRGA